ncbi:hypothetical protein [Winogradskyella helgolandensis]|uniref:hypothetical protein n=1 Tax=Winogradskyella helgolandensis TaxID=2697010 RepID=UPI0015C9F5CF|nr:hypothetical protein [Winogradskyella helgolandensis]
MKTPDYSDPNAKHELDFLSQYQEKGYTSNFRVENEKLIASGEDNTYKPEDVHVVAEHRYEGMSNPSDQSILYVITTDDGKKGTLINAYGPSADLEVHEFMEAIPEKNIDHDDSILNID